MARRSTRNLLGMFAAAEVDDRSIGPDVSSDIQLVYVVDDFAESTFSWAGVGGREAAAVGEHGLLTLEVRNTRGAMIDGFSAAQDPHFGNEASVVIWTSDTRPSLTGAAAPPFELQAGPPPQGAPQIGTGNFPVSSYRLLNVATGIWKPFLVDQGRFFNIAFGTVNVACFLGLRWHELSRTG